MLASFLLILVLIHVTLRLRLIPESLRVLYQVWFAISFTLTLASAGTTSFILEFILLKVLGVSIRKKEELCVANGWYHWNAMLLWNPQIQLHWKDDEGRKKLKKTPPRSAIMTNHTSNLDPFIAAASAPVEVMSSSRIFVKSSLCNIPILGWYFKAAGQFPVYFNSSKDGNFSVNKDKQAETARRVKLHLDRGGRLAMYPEGAVNKNAAAGLQTFRLGVFNTVIEHKMPLAFAVYVGIDDCWPVKSIIGGFPADIYYDYEDFDVTYTSKSCTETAQELSERMRVSMQRSYDELCELKRKKEGASTLPTKKGN